MQNVRLRHSERSEESLFDRENPGCSKGQERCFASLSMTSDVRSGIFLRPVQCTSTGTSRKISSDGILARFREPGTSFAFLRLICDALDN